MGYLIIMTKRGAASGDARVCGYAESLESAEAVIEYYRCIASRSWAFFYVSLGVENMAPLGIRAFANPNEDIQAEERSTYRPEPDAEEEPMEGSS